jgi:pimeloyl-ACP methyl ester carboxylesterase
MVAATSRVCSYNRAGIGGSDPAPTPRTAGDAVTDLHALLGAADLEPPYVLVGFSFGGLVTQLFASTYPKETAGLVLVDSNHPREIETFESHLTQRQIREDRAQVLANPEGMDPYQSVGEFEAAGSLPRVPLMVVSAGVSEGWPPGWKPALFDRLWAELQRDLANSIPGGRQVIADNSRHDVPQEAPNVVADAIETVVKRL